MEVRKPAAFNALRSRSASARGGPNSRSVPVISSTNAHAVPRLASLLCFFDARRKAGRALQQHRARCGFAFKRAGQQAQFSILAGERLGLQPGHAGCCALQPRQAVHGADLFERRAALEHRDGQRLQIGPQTQQGLRRKLRRMNAGIEWLVHALCVHFQCFGGFRFFDEMQSSGGIRSSGSIPCAGGRPYEAGGFFRPTAKGTKRCRWLRTSKRKPRSTVPPATTGLNAAHSRATAALDWAILRCGPACATTTREVRARSAAWRKRNHVASGIRRACSAAVSPRSSTMAANPPACSSRSVARSAWSSCVHGFAACLRLNRPAGLAAAHPQQLPQIHAVGRGRFGIEGVVCVHPRAYLACGGSLGEKGQRQRRAPRGLRPVDFADGADRQAAVKQLHPPRQCRWRRFRGWCAAQGSAPPGNCVPGRARFRDGGRWQSGQTYSPFVRSRFHRPPPSCQHSCPGNLRRLCGMLRAPCVAASLENRRKTF